MKKIKKINNKTINEAVELLQKENSLDFQQKLFMG
jgi:hypothetical protein